MKNSKMARRYEEDFKRQAGQKLDFHPHLHCIVTGGALSPDCKGWRSPKQRKFLFPVRALAALFRGKFLAGLRRLLDEQDLLLPDPALKGSLIDTLRLSLLYSKPWVVYAKRPFGGPQQVLTYLANYTHLEQPAYCRCRCAATKRYLSLSRLSLRLTVRAINAFYLGVHPSLQPPYPASGIGPYPPLWNPR
jgi:Putative transposase